MEVKQATYEVKAPMIRSISSTFAANIGCLVVGLVSSIILNRTLGPEGKGLYATLLTSGQLLMIVAACGVGKSVTYYLAAREEDRFAVFRNFLTLAAGAMMFSLLLLSVLYALPIPQAALEGNGLYLGLLIVLSLAHGFGLGALRGLKQFTICNLVSLTTSALFLGLLLAALITGALDARTALICKASGFGLVLVLLATQLRARGFGWRFGAEPRLMRKIFLYGLGFFFYQIFQNLNYRFDIILVSHLTSFAEAGWYSTGTGLAELIWYFPNAIGTVLFPVAAGLKEKESDALVAQVCRWSLLIMSVGVAGLVLVAPYLVTTLYGDRFLPTVTVIYSLSLGIITNGMFQILGIHLAARKRLKTLTVITAAGFAANLALNFLLIPLWGLVGAGLSSTISYSISGFLTAWMFRRTTGLPWSDLFYISGEEFRRVWGSILRKVRGGSV